MEKSKIIHSLPPKELTDIFEQIQIFQNYRVAEEMWEIEEKIFREEKLIPGLFDKHYSTLKYSPEKGKEKYIIDYAKKCPGVDEFLCYHFHKADGRLKRTGVTMVRGKGIGEMERFNLSAFLKDQSTKRICALFISEGHVIKSGVKFEYKIEC